MSQKVEKNQMIKKGSTKTWSRKLDYLNLKEVCLA